MMVLTEKFLDDVLFEAMRKFMPDRECEHPVIIIGHPRQPVSHAQPTTGSRESVRGRVSQVEDGVR
jgi:hypothetical protein